MACYQLFTFVFNFRNIVLSLGKSVGSLNEHECIINNVYVIKFLLERREVFI